MTALLHPFTELDTIRRDLDSLFNYTIEPAAETEETDTGYHLRLEL